MQRRSSYSVYYLSENLYMADFDAARQNMVDCQLRTNKIIDETLIRQFETVPRELFVEETLQSIAYIDESVSLKDGRHLMEPMVLARILQDLTINPDFGQIEMDPEYIAVEIIPQTLLDQLANGGRLATVIDDIKGIGKAMLFVKRDGNVSQRVLFDASVPRLPGFKTKMGFVF